MSRLIAALESVEHLLEAIPDAAERLSPLIQHLRASEALVLDLIDAANAGREHAAPSAEAEGDLEFGLMLYRLQHPTEEHNNLMQLNHVHAIVTQALQRFAPQSRITEDMFSSFFRIAYNVGIVAADGGLWTPGKYALLDPLWLAPIANYAINLLDPDSIYHPYPTNPYNATIGADKKRISIAIIGDWGSGAYDTDYAGQGPAVAVMAAVRNMQPDYVVHLGDTYYSGTDDRLPWHEEQHNLLDQWHSGTGAETSFAINANHEMYGAAQVLIGVALANGTPFEHQNRTPYFGLEFGNWVILGLDSAYFDPSTLYMQGALGNASNIQQQNFIHAQYGDLSGKKVLVMTHHNPMSFDGSTITPNKKAGTALWDGMNSALGNRNPDVWYWGHLHLGVAYNSNSAVGAEGTLGRCVGHSAMPFGNAHGMDLQNVDYYAHTPLNVGTKQVQNGFAIVTLDSDGSLTETFYEVDANGKCIPAWTNPPSS